MSSDDMTDFVKEQNKWAKQQAHISSELYAVVVCGEKYLAKYHGDRENKFFCLFKPKRGSPLIPSKFVGLYSDDRRAWTYLA